MGKAIFILLLTYSNAEVFYINGNPHKEIIVSSPESAALTLYEHQKNSEMYGHWSAVLYKIDFEKMYIDTIPIPKVEFK